MAIQPTAELIRAIWKYKNGDNGAFGDIYRLSRPYLAKVAANVINRVVVNGSRELLEDVLQDSFMTIAEKLNTLQNEEAFFQWAGQITTNHALRVLKKDTQWRDMVQPEDDLVYEIPDERFIPEDILENREKQQLIRNMLQELPVGQYFCLVEYFYNGLKEREIAEKLEMPLGTVKTNLSRAKKKLKEIVQTHEKKHGVKLYSMSWLLLLLFWDDIKGLFSASGMLVVEEAAEVYTAGTAAGSASAGAAGGASAAGDAAAAGSAAGTGLAVKIVAGVLAVVLAATAGGVAAVALPKKNNDNDKHREKIHAQQTQWEASDVLAEQEDDAGLMEQETNPAEPGMATPREAIKAADVDWANLPVLTPTNVAVLENALGSLQPGKATGKIIQVDALPDDHEKTLDGQLCNVEYMGGNTVILSGENAQGERMEVTVKCDGALWEIQSVLKSEYAEKLHPFNDGMRRNTIPAMPCGWEITDENLLSRSGALCMGMVYWREILGNTDFSVTGVNSKNGWYTLALGEPNKFYQSNVALWDVIKINKKTLEIVHEDVDYSVLDTPQDVLEKLDPDAPVYPDHDPIVVEPDVPEQTKPADTKTRYGDVVLSAEELDFFNRMLRDVYLPVPATGPAISYEKGYEWVLANQFIINCAGENGLLRGTKTANGLVVSKADVTAFLLDTLGWEAPYDVSEYNGILDNGNNTYLIPHYGGDKDNIGINNISVVTYDRILVYVHRPMHNTSYHGCFDRDENSPYGWTLVSLKDTEREIGSGSMALGLFERGLVAPKEGYALTGISDQELSMEGAEAYVRHYLKKTTGEHYSYVKAEDWGLVANSYYTYKVTAKNNAGKETVYLIGTSDAALAEYHGDNVARTWFEWELVE